jgi:hypothetical protein
MKMRLVWWLATTAVYASLSSAQCLPSGRAQFAAGLDALRRGEMGAAATAFRQLVQAQPDCAEARNNLAVVLFEQGQLQEAAAQLRHALQVRPDYRRARFNLTHVETMLAAGTLPTPRQDPPELSTEGLPEEEQHAPAATPAPPQPSPPVSAPTTTPVPSSPNPSSAATATKVTPALTTALPAEIAALEPEGSIACRVDLSQKRVCLYQRNAGAIAGKGCYAITETHGQGWPSWLITGDTRGQRIRLHDLSGRLRLKIIPHDASVAGDIVRLRTADFDALARTVVPGRTAWVVAPSPGSQVSADTNAAVRARIEEWRSAWQDKRFDDYVGFYGPAFVPQSEPDIARWRSRKRSHFERSGPITVEISPASLFVVDNGAAVVATFEQTYRAGAASARDFKALLWERHGDRWLISAERVLK